MKPVKNESPAFDFEIGDKITSTLRGNEAIFQGLISCYHRAIAPSCNSCKSEGYLLIVKEDGKPRNSFVCLGWDSETFWKK